MRTTPSLTLNDVIKALPQLSDSDRDAIKAAIEQLEVSGTDEREAAVFDALRKSLDVKVSLRSLGQSQTAKQWRKNWKHFTDFADSLFPSRSSQVERMYVYRFLFGLLADSSAQEPSLATVASSMGKVESVFDYAFPSYRASGMISVLEKAVFGGDR